MRAARPHDATTRLQPKGRHAIIHFAEGLFGFSDCKDFVLIDSESLSPFRLLRSFDAPHVSFLVVEAMLLIHGYGEVVPARELETIGDSGPTKTAVFVIVTIGSTPETSSGNLQAPLLVNYDKMIGKQIILTDSGFSVRHPLV
jgi:flagellar assembly factor FliW